ncbi:MAG: carbon-nitrogen hydrolase family protein [Acidimicrobiia bacterium]
MRAFLAAVQCDKSALTRNLAMHVRLLEEAARAGCDIAVFPEMSLTGSVDPRSHPEDAVAIHHDAVDELARATDSGVAALFGVAERSDDEFFITQICARDGRVAGSYRKRYLGEGEEGFTPGDKPALFELRREAFGVAICAEGGVDYPFSEPARAGARIVFFCAAPGLDGRRTDEAGWRDGFAWWEECGLGDAQRHARNNRVWVALTTQAGSTRDEEFPGLAALVSPDGEVVARLSDWQPGTLIVDLPLSAVS